MISGKDLRVERFYVYDIFFQNQNWSETLKMVEGYKFFGETLRLLLFF